MDTAAAALSLRTPHEEVTHGDASPAGRTLSLPTIGGDAGRTAHLEDRIRILEQAIEQLHAALSSEIESHRREQLSTRQMTEAGMTNLNHTVQAAMTASNAVMGDLQRQVVEANARVEAITEQQEAIGKGMEQLQMMTILQLKASGLVKLVGGDEDGES